MAEPERGNEKGTYERSESMFDDNFLVVAAIDFGTTFSGYAFSFKDDFEKDPLKIISNQAWNSGGSAHCLLSLKTPTCLLLDEDQNMVAFGYEAENEYAELVSMDEHHGYYYFTRFKMCLYHNKVSSTWSTYH